MNYQTLRKGTRAALTWETVQRILHTDGVAGLAGRRLSDRFHPDRKFPLALDDDRLVVLGIEGEYLGRSLGHPPETILRHLENGDWFIHDEKPAGAPVNLNLLKEITS